jgi:hypothetical protein
VMPSNRVRSVDPPIATRSEPGRLLSPCAAPLRVYPPNVVIFGAP